jgi:hypothetical protein
VLQETRGQQPSRARRSRPENAWRGVPFPGGGGAYDYHVVGMLPGRRRGHGRSFQVGHGGVAKARSRGRGLSSPERGWARPGHSRASVSTPGTVLASLGWPLESPLLPPSLPKLVLSGLKCWTGRPVQPVCGPPGTRLTALPWRAPSSPRSRGARPPARALVRPRTAGRSAVVRLRGWLCCACALVHPDGRLPWVCDVSGAVSSCGSRGRCGHVPCSDG